MAHLSPIQKIVFTAAAAVGIGAGGYLSFWMRTPEYAAGEIYQAVQQKDFQRFRERVDLEKVYGAAIDDLAAEAERSDTRDHQIAAGLMKSLKRPLVNAMIRETEAEFRPGPDENGDSLLTPLVSAAKSYVGGAALSMTDIVDVVQDGDTATARVKLHDKDLGKDFTWDILLEKDANDQWAATKVLNLTDYLAARKAALEAKS